MLYLVDDAADYRFLIQHVFKLFLPHYALRLFTDGLELVQHMEQAAVASPPDSAYSEPAISLPGLIVLDVDMPKLNGLQTLERLKQDPLWQTVPVVMMSNRVEAGFITMAHDLGAATYLTKPMDITALRTMMEQLCHQWLDT